MIWAKPRHHLSRTKCPASIKVPHFIHSQGATQPSSSSLSRKSVNDAGQVASFRTILYAAALPPIPIRALFLHLSRESSRVRLHPAQWRATKHNSGTRALLRLNKSELFTSLVAGTTTCDTFG